MWVQLAAAVLGSGVLNAPEIPSAPTMISGPTHGDWNVNLGGSGVALQGGEALGTILLIAGTAVVAIWLLNRK